MSLCAYLCLCTSVSICTDHGLWGLNELNGPPSSYVEILTPTGWYRGRGWLWEVMMSQAGAPMSRMRALQKGPQRAVLHLPPREKTEGGGSLEPGGVLSPDLGPQPPDTGETRVCHAEAPRLWFLAVAAGTDSHSPLFALVPGDAFCWLKGRLSLLGASSNGGPAGRCPGSPRLSRFSRRWSGGNVTTDPPEPRE